MWVIHPAGAVIDCTHIGTLIGDKILSWSALVEVLC